MTHDKNISLDSNNIVKPFMSNYDCEFIENVLVKKIIKLEKIRILEWGSGTGTIYYINIINSYNKNFEWHSVEHNPQWANKIEKEIDDHRFNLRLFDYGAYSRSETRNICMMDYIKYPSSLGIKFDLIIIDGRCRKRCLFEVYNLLKQNGAVFLHDASRTHYEDGKRIFKNGKMVSESLWASI